MLEPLHGCKLWFDYTKFYSLWLAASSKADFSNVKEFALQLGWINFWKKDKKRDKNQEVDKSLGQKGSMAQKKGISEGLALLSQVFKLISGKVCEATIEWLEN